MQEDIDRRNIIEKLETHKIMQEILQKPIVN